MKLGIVSDVHCNAPALARALELMGDVDEVISAGDLIYEYRFSNEVLDIVRERGIRTILGNHEAVFLGPQGARARSNGRVNQDHLRFLQERSFTLETTIAGKKLLVVHGSPWEPHNEYLYPSHPKLARLQELGADIVIMGHTHYAMASQKGRTLVINPGSCGEARDPRNGYRLTYAILDVASGEVVINAFPDPLRQVPVPNLERK